MLSATSRLMRKLFQVITVSLMFLLGTLLPTLLNRVIDTTPLRLLRAASSHSRRSEPSHVVAASPSTADLQTPSGSNTLNCSRLDALQRNVETGQEETCDEILERPSLTYKPTFLSEVPKGTQLKRRTRVTGPPGFGVP